MASEPVAQLNLHTAIRQGLRCRSGTEFQSTVQDILRQRLPGYVPIVPHGRDGDGGNDGYSKTDGIYTQIYATESARLPGREAARKVVADFEKILRTWNTTTPVREYWLLANAQGSNVHVEGALHDISRRHRIKTRFLGSAELAEEVAALPIPRIEELMGFAVSHSNSTTSSPAALQLLASLTSSQLVGLHQLASMPAPVPRRLCEQLLPSLTNWKALWTWLRERGWATFKSNLVQLDHGVVELCRQNRPEQRKACTRWIAPLLSHGSTDCLYFAVLPLLGLGLKKKALQVAIRAGLEIEDSGWATAVFEMLAALSKPELMRELPRADRHALRVARGHLMSAMARYDEALAEYSQCLRTRGTWPTRTSKGLVLLNCGVAAYLSGQTHLASKRYGEAIAWARAHRDDWTLGRAATNLAQMSDDTPIEQLEALILEAETAKKRCDDKAGLVGIAMARGLLAVRRNDSAQALRHFATAGRLARTNRMPEVLADVHFNLGKSAGDLELWRQAVRDYRRSLAEARKQRDAYREARARVGIAESLFILNDLDACRKQIRILADLPAESRWASMRLTGLHGAIALQLRAKGRAVPRDVAKALAFARQSGEQQWIGQLLTDPVLGRSTHASPKALTALLDKGVAEATGGRLESAAHVFREVWCMSVGTCDADPELEARSHSLFSRVLKRGGLNPAIAIEHLKWQYGAHLQLGQPWKALEALRACAVRAHRAGLWEDYARAVDQQGVTLQELGSAKAAEPLHREALRCATRHGLPEQQRAALCNLAECLRACDRLQAAHRASKRALALHELEQDPAGYVSVLHNHYLTERDSGHRSAHRTLARCEALAKTYGLVNETARAVMARGNEAWKRGDRKRAIANFRKAVRFGARDQASTTADDARHNLALLLRDDGRSDDALRVLQHVNPARQTTLQKLHGISLAGLLLEDSGSLMMAAETWRSAADLAAMLGDAASRKYYANRARFLAARPADIPAFQQAERLLKALRRSPMQSLQRRYDEANTFCTNSRMAPYQVHVHRALAERLSATASVDGLDSGAQASVASLIAAYPDANGLRWATEMHIQWLTRLKVSRAKLVRLRSRTQSWLSGLLKPIGHESLVPLFLTGFDAVIRASRRPA